MIPWLFPLAILVLVIVFAVAPLWAVGIVAAVIVLAAGFAWRDHVREDPGQGLPRWMSGWRPPR